MRRQSRVAQERIWSGGPPAEGDVELHEIGGAAARDRHGNLASATSTGGMTNKRWGRVGDTPIIGAGRQAPRVAP